MTDAHNDILMSLSNEAYRKMEAPVQWLTVSQAAALLKVSERTIRRRCEAGKLAARLDSNESGSVWLIDAAAISAVNSADATDKKNATADKLRSENGLSAVNAADTADSRNKAAVIPADGQIEAISGNVARLNQEVEQLKSFIAGGAMQAIQERLANLPDAEMMRTEVAQAVEKGITQALAADAQQQAETASKDDVKAILEELKRVRDDNAALRSEIEAQREEQGQKRGLFGWLKR